MAGLVVVPAASASAGRYTTAVKIHNMTERTLQTSDVFQQPWGHGPYFENAQPVVGSPLPAKHQGHYELKTISGYKVTVEIYYNVWNDVGQLIGRIKTVTTVDGTGYLWNYGAESHFCSFDGVVSCEVKGDTYVLQDAAEKR